jgi:hypothetical protein
MNVLTLFGNEQPRYISPEDLVHPEVYLDDFNPEHIPITLEEITKQAQGTTPVKFEQIIQPGGVHFGMSQQQVKKAVGKAQFIIENDINLPSHLIFLRRRKLGKVVLATQYHFIHDQLFLVVDEFNRQKEYLMKALNHSLNGYFHAIGSIYIQPGINQVLRDQRGTQLIIEYQNSLVVRFFQPRILQKWLP